MAASRRSGRSLRAALCGEHRFGTAKNRLCRNRQYGFTHGGASGESGVRRDGIRRAARNSCAVLGMARGHPAESLQQLGERAEAVITMLPDHNVVREVILGESGIANTLREGSIVIDMSTSDPVATRALAKDLEPLRIAVVYAPVMRGVLFAK